MRCGNLPKESYAHDCHVVGCFLYMASYNFRTFSANLLSADLVLHASLGSWTARNFFVSPPMVDVPVGLSGAVLGLFETFFASQNIYSQVEM